MGKAEQLNSPGLALQRASGGGRHQRERSTLESAGIDGGIPLTVLTSALFLSLWVAFGSLVLAVTDGLGAHPGRRMTVGLLLVVATASALWRRRRVCASLWRRPWLVLGVAAAELAVVGLDGFVGGPYAAFTLTSIGIAVVVAPSRIVWWCVAILVVGYSVGVLVGHSPAQLVSAGQLAGALGQAFAYPFAAVSLLGLAALFKRFMSNAALILDEIRAGVPALTPALTSAIAKPGSVVPLLPAGRSVVRLTPAEVRVVEGLARGKAAKALAYEWGVALATVRTHIRRAKRKTGARTLRQLAALAANPDWPEVIVDDQ